MQELDQRDRQLLNILQTEIPIVSTPYAVIGQMIDMSEKEVIKRAQRLRKDGMIRQITAMFDGRLLGYRSCLVAAQVPEDRIEQAAASISAHPGVSQNYRRNHEFNLWFTISVSPDSRLGLDKTVELLAKEGGCSVARLFPTIRLLKSNSLEAEAGGPEHGADSVPESVSLSPEDIFIIRLFQGEFPLQPRPFEFMGRNESLDPDVLLDAARRFSSAHQLRKVIAMVDTRKPAFSATAMGVWAIPAARIDELVSRLASYRAVSHCYLRPTYDDWPYNIFTTVHGRSVDECESVLRAISKDVAVSEMRALFPTREYKRARVSFFSPDFELWESRHGATADEETVAS